MTLEMNATVLFVNHQKETLQRSIGIDHHPQFVLVYETNERLL